MRNELLDMLTSADAAAAEYDEIELALSANTAQAVRFVGDHLEPGDRLLELGVGTGRLALPLSERGVTVTGLDFSDSMLDRLRSRAGAEQLSVVKGDMTEFTLEGHFQVVLCAFNTLYSLHSQEQQLRCIRSAARHLAPGGKLILETQAIGLSEFVNNKTIAPLEIASDHADIVLITHDPAAQTINRDVVRFGSDGRLARAPLTMRYIWPSELNLMAALSELTPVTQTAGWSAAPYEGAGYCVSVYQK